MDQVGHLTFSVHFALFPEKIQEDKGNKSKMLRKRLRLPDFAFLFKSASERLTG